MFYSPEHTWAYEPVLRQDEQAVFTVPVAEYGIVIKLRDGTEYVIEDID